MTDPIKAALAEAGGAVTSREDALGIAPAVSEADAEKVAAAAVAAFLDAYAAHIDPRSIAGEWFPRFARLVEDAAREARDGR
jgi:hypothetical protein